MKKRLLLSLLIHAIVFIPFSHCQGYIDNSSQWYFFGRYVDINQHRVYDSFTVEEEVTVNDTAYYKMITHRIDSLFSGTGAFIRVDSFEYSGPYLREANSQFFLRYAPEENEILFYVFDLNIGDTIPNNFMPSETFSDSSVMVVGIDTIGSGNLVRKRFHTNFPDIQLIEGVCNNRGWRMPEYPLDEETAIADYPSTTICYSMNGETLQIDATRNCQLAITTAIGELTKPNYSVKVFPNPASDFVELQISPPLEGDVDIAIYNLQGQRLFSDRRLIFDISQIKTTNLKSETYLLTLKSGRGDLINTVKFRVQK